MSTKPASLANRERHPFSALLTQIRVRKAGLTQTRLAELAGYDQAILVRMCQGKKDLTGPSGRDRIVRIIAVLQDMGVLSLRSEANGLLAAAGQPPLYQGTPVEKSLLDRLQDAGTALPMATRYHPPAALTNLVGRETEVAAAIQALTHTRLVTLTGPGGVGKTQLGIEVANRVAGAFSHGSCFVPFATLASWHEAPGALLRALEIRASPTQTEADAAASYLRDKHLLIVFDNCEHVLEAASFIASILSGSPRVKVLATSREALKIGGEHLLVLDPLSPDAATDLFVQRAQAHSRLVATNASARRDIDAICQRLDRLPLAIEIAAARCRQFTPAALLARIAEADGSPHDAFEALGLLSNARRDGPARHESVRTAIGWSYGLLTDDEQWLLRHVAIFTGGAQFEQIEALYQRLSPAAFGSHSSCVDALGSLIDKSLVVTIEQADESLRYDMLSLIRQFALEKLHERGELPAARRCHAEIFADYAERIRESFARTGRQVHFTWLERDRLNIQNALDWGLVDGGDPLIGCRLVAALQLPWRTDVAQMPAIRRWITLAQQALTPDMPPAVLGGVYQGMAQFNLSSSWSDAVGAAQTALRHYEQTTDQAGIADAMGAVAACAFQSDPSDVRALDQLHRAIQLARDSGYALIEHCLFETHIDHLMLSGQDERALAAAHEAIRSCERTGDVANLCRVLLILVMQFMAKRRFEEAREAAERAAAYAEQIHDLYTFMTARGNVAECMRLSGDAQAALQMLEELIAAARISAARMTLRYPKIFLAKSLNDLRQPDRARAVILNLIEDTLAEEGMPPGAFAYLFDVLACSAILSSDPSRAAVLFGAADADLMLGLRVRGSYNDEEFGRYRQRAMDELGADRFEALLSQGRRMPLVEAVAYAQAWT